MQSRSVAQRVVRMLRIPVGFLLLFIKATQTIMLLAGLAAVVLVNSLFLCTKRFLAATFPGACRCFVPLIGR